MQSRARVATFLSLTLAAVVAACTYASPGEGNAVAAVDTAATRPAAYVGPVPASLPRLNDVDVQMSAAAAPATETFATLQGAAAGAAVGERELRAADEVVVYERREADVRAAAPNRVRLALARQAAVNAVGGTTIAAPPAELVARFEARDSSGNTLAIFPLRHTQVSAEISGYLARTVVEQRYEHPAGAGSRPVEGVYVFPLPSTAAVHDFVMRVGERTIVGVVRPRAEAQRIYQEARARGQTASLLEQERPNVFTQSVANIPVDEAVTVRIAYVERLAYERGEYAWVFPMVVGPRYSPSGAPSMVARNVSDEEPSGSGNTTGSRGNNSLVSEGPRRVSAARISPPLLRPGTRSGHDVGLVVTLDAGVAVRDLAVRSHDVRVEEPSASRRVVTLASHDSIANRDFIMRWRVGGAETQFGVLAHRSTRGSGGYFSLLAQPPRAPADLQVVPRELTFIVDVSGSMMGVPIDIAKGLVAQSLDRLRPDDRFNIVVFASGNGQLWERAMPNTRANVAEARRYLTSLQGSGGTEMLAGLRRALTSHHDAEFLQMYVFLTDGYVGNEDEILRVVKEEKGDARFFGFGIGSSVNRYLIDGIGEHGAGTSMVVTPREQAQGDLAVGRLFDAIDSPVLVDVAIDWNGLPVAEVYPARPRDLFAGQTLAVVGRFTRAARGTAYVTGRAGRRRVRVPVEVNFAGAGSEHAALAPTWARARIAELSNELLVADAERARTLEEEITRTAMTHRLVSQFTSFVAVDESRVVGDGRPTRLFQPVEVPEGVDYRGVMGGERPAGDPRRVEAWGVTLQQTMEGHVRVIDVEANGVAARAGLRAGLVIARVDRGDVSDLGGLEARLLQGGRRATLSLSGGLEISLPVP